MLGFLKVVLRGLLSIVLLPVILLVWISYGIYCLVLFLIMFVKSTILFFKGESGIEDLPEDIESKRILLEKEQAQDNATQMMSAMYQTAMNTLAAQQAMLNQNQQPAQQIPETEVSPIDVNTQDLETEEPQTEEGVNNDDTNIS